MPEKGGATRQGGCKELVEPILLQQFLQGSVSPCKDGVHYRLGVRLLGWRGSCRKRDISQLLPTIS